MKKFLLIVPVLALFAAAFVGCTQHQKWNHAQRKTMRAALHDYRKMVYLEDLTDPEFVLFTDEVANTLEGSYPVYTTFIEMEGVNDTVDMVVVTTIVEELDADARNMRHIFPYNYLVAEGILPEGLDLGQQHAFYNCLAGKVNDTYASTMQFFNAILADTTDLSRPRRRDPRGATALFGGAEREADTSGGDCPAPLPAIKTSGGAVHLTAPPHFAYAPDHLSAKSDRAMPSSRPRSSARPRRRPRHE